MRAWSLASEEGHQGQHGDEDSICTHIAYMGLGSLFFCISITTILRLSPYHVLHMFVILVSNLLCCFVIPSYICSRTLRMIENPRIGMELRSTLAVFVMKTETDDGIEPARVRWVKNVIYGE